MSINMNTLLSNLVDFYSENEYLVHLFENHAGSDVYNDIVDYLDIYNSDWRKNKGLGYQAIFLISEIIEDLDYPENDTYVDYLTRLYEKIVDKYPSSFQYNQNNRKDISSIEFEAYCEVNEYFFDSPEHIKDEDYLLRPAFVKYEYEKLAELELKVFQEFKALDDEIIHVWF